jgi:3-methyladenine DNA glycosylase AlkC
VAQDWDPGDPEDPLRGFAAWPMIEMVGFYGLDEPEASLATLRRLTGLFSAEFAIRPFIEQDTPGVLAELSEWTGDADEHVRRLVSEGTRPRLPWGRRLRAFQRDPRPVLTLLEKLKDDPSEYVRRSVANNLNDIAKDNPEPMVATCRRWARGASDERRWIIRHATRTLVKQGDPEALALLGFDPEVAVEASLTLAPRRLLLGASLRLDAELRSTGRHAQPLVVDYVVHHVKKGGHSTPKVFKLRQLELAAGERVVLSKTHPVRKISTRVYYPGRHRVELLVNGRPHAEAAFDLRLA